MEINVKNTGKSVRKCAFGINKAFTSLQPMQYKIASYLYYEVVRASYIENKINSSHCSTYSYFT